MITSIEEINRFLSRARDYKEMGKLDFIRGRKEKYTLGELGISFRDAFHWIEVLTFENYSQGPMADRDRPQEEVWVFGIPEEPRDIYLKLKFRQDRDDLLFLSFHYAEHPMTYPYQVTAGSK